MGVSTSLHLLDTREQTDLLVPPIMQMDSVNKIGALCITDGPIRMVIVDSIITLFR